MAETVTEEKKTVTEAEDEKNRPVEVYSEVAETTAPDMEEDRMKAAVLAYAKYLREHDLEPGDATFVEPEEIGIEPAEEKADTETAGKEDLRPEEPETVEEAPEAPEEKPKETEKSAKPEDAKPEAAKTEKSAEKSPKKKKKTIASQQEKKKKEREKRKTAYKTKFMKGGSKEPLAAITDIHDKVQDGIDGTAATLGRQFVTWGHRASVSYKNSRRVIGLALLGIALLAAGILVIFDRFTVYEYAYNGMILGYVQEQEEVTDILDIAGRKLSSNNGGAGVEFVANQNITFKLVDGRGKSTDDADTAVNKLIYMTDIEVEAYAVYDGMNVKAIVKSSDDAETLLSQTKAELSTPDRGMKLVSSKFTNDLDIRPVNVLLSSVQSNGKAQKQMIKGGSMETFHIVEKDESLEDIATQFGVEATDIYDEDNEQPVAEVEQGDTVCIRNMVEPVSVEMVEEGKRKEVIEYKTILEESDEYYKGDTYLKQEGVDQIQIFEGRITKVAGEITERKETGETDIIEEGQDKIIIIGTAERPKTAPTGTFQMPIKTYVVTSEYGGRWGRMHDGMDFGAPTGTPIYATDGGTVIRASYYGGYGNCLEIDHGNGVVSRYAHCSALLVSTGDLVYQGQEVARVGNTGHSFGSHLHFEVRVNGSSRNPRNYVNP